jgi:hypothetical protein
VPHALRPDGHWRVFYTAQHGDNVTFEVVRASNDGSQDDPD